MAVTVIVNPTTMYHFDSNYAKSTCTSSLKCLFPFSINILLDRNGGQIFSQIIHCSDTWRIIFEARPLNHPDLLFCIDRPTPTPNLPDGLLATVSRRSRSRYRNCSRLCRLTFCHSLYLSFQVHRHPLSLPHVSVTMTYLYHKAL